MIFDKKDCVPTPPYNHKGFTLLLNDLCHCERSEAIHRGLKDQSVNNGLPRKSFGFSRNDGFTLAETLITLVIVGVVAALTVPALLNNSEDLKYRAALLKSYKTLSEAFRLTYGYNYDDFTNWEYVHSRDFTQDVFNKLSKHLQVAKVCGYSAGRNECWADKTYAKNKQFAQWFTEDGSFAGDSEAFFFVLNDGTSIIMDVWGINSVPAGVSKNLIDSGSNLGFFVDVNGKKKPNMQGKDIFVFLLTKRGIVPGGIDNKSANCDNLSINYNWDCAAKVIQSAQ